MKKHFWNLFVIVTSLALLICAGKSASAFPADADTEAVADRLRSKCAAESAVQNPAEEYEEELVLKNQAAARDSDRLNEYLTNHAEGPLHRYYAGHYISKEQLLTILLSCDAPGCVDELEEIGFETAIDVKRGAFGSYYKTMELLNEINSRISRINLAVLHDDGTEAEKSLMEYYPCTHYDHLTNSIWISVAARDQKTEASAVSLFKKLVGDYPDITYGACEKAKVTADLYTTVRPGQGLAIYTTTLSDGGDYSAGYRAKRTENGVTYNGIVTSAHYNSSYDTVCLYDSPNTREAIAAESHTRL